MAQIIHFPKPTSLPIDLPRKEGWLLDFPQPPQSEWAAVLPEHMASAMCDADPNGDIA